MKNTSIKLLITTLVATGIILLSSCTLSHTPTTKVNTLGGIPSNAEVNIAPPTPTTESLSSSGRPIPNIR